MMKQVAKKIVREPMEILKEAREQVMGEPNPEQPEAGKVSQAGEMSEENKAKMRLQSSRQIQALEAELKDLQREKLEKERADVISEQQEKEKISQKPVLPLASKQGRKVKFGGWKQKVQSLIREPETRQQSVG